MIEYKDSKRIVALEADTATTEEVYNYTTTQSTYNKLTGTPTGYSCDAVGVELVSSIFAGKYIKTGKWMLKRVGTLGSNAFMKVQDSSGTVKATSAGVAASGISNSAYEYVTFTLPTAVELANGDRVYVEYLGADTSGDYLSIGEKHPSTTPTGWEYTIYNVRDVNGNNPSGVWGDDGLPTALVPVATFDSAPSSNKPTDVQDNSILVEKDTARRYWFDAESSVDATFEDDFSGADNWTDSGSTPSVNTSTDVIDFEAATASNIKAQTTYDLTSTSDTKWTLRCKLNVTTFTQPTTEYHRFFIGLSSSTSNLNTSEDAIGLKYELGESSLDRLVAIDTNGSAIRATTGTNFTHTSAVETLYVEIIRQSATTFDVNLRTGSHSGTLVEAKTGVGCSSSTTGLRYIKIGSYSDNGGNGELSGTIDDVKFYNDITSVTTPATWTMQPTKQFDFSSSAGWGQTGTQQTVNTSSGVIDWNAIAQNAVHALSYDLGAVVEDKWVLRYKWVIANHNLGSNPGLFLAVGLSDKDNTVGGASNQDSVSLGAYVGGGTDIIRLQHSDGGNMTANTELFAETNTEATWYAEIVKNGTSVTASIYPDSTYGTATETETATVSGTGFQYIVVKSRSDNTNGGSVYNGTIDDMKFYNGVTSIN